MDKACHMTYETFSYRQLEIKSMQDLSIDIKKKIFDSHILSLNDENETRGTCQ